jgi:hypothetical protein
MFSIRASIALGCLLACAGLASAQQTVDAGSVSGRVVDEVQIVIPGVTVAAVHRLTGVSATAITGEDGRFRFPYLRIGTYELTVTLAGFTPAQRSVTVSAGSAFELAFELEIASVTETITIVDEAPVIDTARTQIAATLSDAEVVALPLNGRNFLDLALLSPGVAPANIASTQLFPETSAVPGVTLSVGSQRNLSNNFVVDGLSANDDAAGLSGITYGVDAIEQFQVITSGAQAEFGRALGGYVNVVTRSGNNTLRGTVYDFVRDDALNAANALSGTTLPMHQSQLGASIGGPVIRNRTFYFVNVEKRLLDQSGLTTISDGNTSVINARLSGTGYQGPAVATGIYSSPVDSLNLLAKVDQQYGVGHQFSARYGRYDVAADNARGAGGLAAPSASAGLESTDQVFAISNALVLSSRSLLETRAQVADSHLEAPPTDPIGPAVAIAGVATFGTSSTSPTARVNRLYQLVNNFAFVAGNHAWRAGVDVLLNADEITYPRSIRGSYTFASMPNFLTGFYNNAGFAQTFGATAVTQDNPNVGLYVQDEWKITNTVTLNAGIRYDLQFLESITTDRNNVSPRLGVAWTPTPSGRTIVRGSAGLYYDRLPLRALANALLSAGNTTAVASLKQFLVNLSPGQAGAPVFPAILPAPVPSVTLPNLTTMDRRVQNAFSRQVSTEIEQQLGQQTTISAGYQYLDGSQLLMAVNQNVPTCVAAGNNNGCRPDSSYANNSQYSSVGDSTYHALLVSLTQRTTHWGHYRVSYTLSKAMNNVGEFFFSSPIDPTDLSKDWGRADNDQRHRLVMNGSFQRGGFQVGGMMQAYSAPPFNVTSGVTTIQGTPGRPIVDGEFIDRNAGEGTAFFSLSARVSQTFKFGGRLQVEVLAEGFNLTNHVNVVTRNTNFGTGAYPTDPLPTFGQITAVGEPRSFQFGARMRF